MNLRQFKRALARIIRQLRKPDPEGSRWGVGALKQQGKPDPEGVHQKGVRFLRKRGKVALFVIVSLVLIFATLIWGAPALLNSSGVMRKVDAVVLFVGPEQSARHSEAMTLLREGYARYLIIPAYGEIKRLNSAGELENLVQSIINRSTMLPLQKAANYKRYYENTHVEALEAKRLMDEHDLKSAMLVSSAYHMRRISMIAGRVFAAQDYSISCFPTRWQIEFTAADWLNKERRKIIISECVKMVWFVVYGVGG